MDALQQKSCEDFNFIIWQTMAKLNLLQYLSVM